jgi:hypothetical protein
MADKINDGGPAYPVVYRMETPNGLVGMDLDAGMSLRDAAALVALQGFCTQSDSSGTWTWPPGLAVAEAWRVADAFIAAREGKSDGM